jgi:secretory lipase
VGPGTRSRPRVRALFAVASLALLAAAVFAPTSFGLAKGKRSVPGAPNVPLGPQGNAFYKATKSDLNGKHGELIQALPIRAPKGARAWKILYISRLENGTPVATSGLVIAPKGKAPKNGRPVLAWAHGTEGGGQQCAPSVPPRPARELVDFFTYMSPFEPDVGVPVLQQLLKAGYVIAATDYQGLGTKGVNQYEIARTETNNVFDSVTAAQGLKPAHAGKRTVALGWSQGGGAAAFMVQQPNLSYGRGIRLLGAAELAPGADIGPDLRGVIPPGPISNTSVAHAAAIRVHLIRGFLAAYPQLDVNQELTADGLQAMQGDGIECINHFAYVLQSNIGIDPSPTLFPKGSVGPAPAPWQQVFDQNTAANGIAPQLPQLVMQGDKDTVINPFSTDDFVLRACKFGQPIQYTHYPGQTHQTIPLAASGEYLAWIADRFAGQPAPTNCK